MANSFWNFVTQLVPNTLAKAEDVSTNLSGVEAGFSLVEAQTLQSIKVTNTPGTINISDTPANRANKIVSFDGAGDVLASIYIGNYRNNHVGVAGTIYNVRDTVKDAAGALGLNNIYICNTTHTSTGTLAVDVANWDILLDSAAAAASAAAALLSENNAAISADFLDDRQLGAFTTAAEPTLDNDGNALLTGAQYFNTDLNSMKAWNGTAWQLTTANAVDVTIADVGTIFTATEVEAALQEVKVIADTGASTNTTQNSSIGTNTTNIAANATRLNAMDTLNTTQDGRLTATEGVANTAATVNTTQNGRLDTIEAINHLIILPPVTTGTSSAYTATVGITAYVTGTVYKVRIHVLSLASASINIDGIGVVTINYYIMNSAGVQAKTPLIAGQMALNIIAELHYDGTNFILLNPSPAYSSFLPELWDNGNVDKGATYTARAGEAIIHNGNVDIRLYMQPATFGTLITSDNLRIGIPGTDYIPNSKINPAGINITDALSFSMTAGNSLNAKIIFSAGKLYIQIDKWTSTTGLALFAITEINTGYIELNGSYRK